MATVKINTQHHYVTLKIEFADKRRYSLTASHSGTRATSSAPQSLPPEDKSILNRVFKAWDAATYTDKTPITGTIGERIAKLAKVAEGCATTTALAEAFEAVTNGVQVPALRDPRVAEKLLPATTKPVAPLQLLAEKFPNLPITGEGSGKYIQRLWMNGFTDAEALATLVRKHYEGRTTKVSDVAYNVSQLRKKLGAANVPAWKKS